MLASSYQESAWCCIVPLHKHWFRAPLSPCRLTHIIFEQSKLVHRTLYTITMQ